MLSHEYLDIALRLQKVESRLNEIERTLNLKLDSIKEILETKIDSSSKINIAYENVLDKQSGSMDKQWNVLKWAKYGLLAAPVATIIAVIANLLQWWLTTGRYFSPS